MPERFVLDNSVLMRAFLPDREWGDIAERVLGLLLAGDIVVVAPRNMMYEFYGAIAKKFRQRHKSVDDALRAVRNFVRLPIQYVESQQLVEAAVRLSFRYHKSFYDMCYFAVAAEQAIPVCTADAKSVSGLGEGFPCRYVLLEHFFDAA